MLWQVPQKLASGMGVGQPRNGGCGFQQTNTCRTKNALTHLLDF